MSLVIGGYHSGSLKNTVAVGKILLVHFTSQGVHVILVEICDGSLGSMGFGIFGHQSAMVHELIEPGGLSGAGGANESGESQGTVRVPIMLLEAVSGHQLSQITGDAAGLLLDG